MRASLSVLGVLVFPALALAQNTPPVVDAGPDQTMFSGNSVVLQGSATDADGNDILFWLWTVESAPPGSSPVFTDPGNPESLFSASVVGDYVLSLVASDGIDTSAKDFVTIHVFQLLPPVAIVTADRIRGSAPLIISFDGSQSVDPQGGPLTFHWQFGDGGISTEISPSHTYGQGFYTMVLTVFDELGQSDFTFLEFAVEAAARLIDDFEAAPFDLQANGSTDPFDQTTQTGLSSDHVIGGERQASLTVNEATGSASAQLTIDGGDDAVALSAESTTTLSLRYPIPAPGINIMFPAGEFTLDVASLSGAASVGLRVDDDLGNVGIAPATPITSPGPFVWPFSAFPNVDLTRVRFIDLTVQSALGTIHSSQFRDLRAQVPPNRAPLADAGDDQTVVVGQEVALSGTASDPEGDPISTWRWTIEAAPPDSTPLLSDTTVPDPVFQPDGVGQYWLSLVANDGHGNVVPDWVTITVVAPAPVPSLSHTALVVLASLLTGMGLAVLRRTRRGRGSALRCPGRGKAMETRPDVDSWRQPLHPCKRKSRRCLVVGFLSSTVLHCALTAPEFDYLPHEGSSPGEPALLMNVTPWRGGCPFCVDRIWDIERDVLVYDVELHGPDIKWFALAPGEYEIECSHGSAAQRHLRTRAARSVGQGWASRVRERQSSRAPRGRLPRPRPP